MLRSSALCLVTVILAISLVTCNIGCQSELQTISVPAGTSVVVALQTSLSTENASEGQTFTAETTEPTVIEGKTVAPAGTIVRGKVSSVAKPGAIKGAAKMTLDFEQLSFADGATYEFDAAPITLAGQSDTEADVERLAAGTVAGAIIGGIAKGGKGAAVGALIGAGAGGTWAVATKGDHIVLEPGQRFRIETTDATEMPVKDTQS